MSKPAQQLREQMQGNILGGMGRYNSPLGVPQADRAALFSSQLRQPAYSPAPITNPYAKMRESAYSGLGNQYGNVQMPNPYSLDRPRGFSSPVFPRPYEGLTAEQFKKLSERFEGNYGDDFIVPEYNLSKPIDLSGFQGMHNQGAFPRPMQLSQPRYNPPMGGMYGGGYGRGYGGGKGGGGMQGRGYGGGMYGMGGYRPASPYSPGRYGNSMTGMGGYMGGYSPYGYGGSTPWGGGSIYGTMGNTRSPFPEGSYFLTPGGARGGMPLYQQLQNYGMIPTFDGDLRVPQTPFGQGGDSTGGGEDPTGGGEDSTNGETTDIGTYPVGSNIRGIMDWARSKGLITGDSVLNLDEYNYLKNTVFPNPVPTKNHYFGSPNYEFQSNLFPGNQQARDAFRDLNELITPYRELQTQDAYSDWWQKTFNNQSGGNTGNTGNANANNRSATPSGIPDYSSWTPEQWNQHWKDNPIYTGGKGGWY